MITKERQKYLNDYKSKNYKKFVFILHKERDIDIIEQLQDVKSKTKWIRETMKKAGLL